MHSVVKISAKEVKHRNSFKAQVNSLCEFIEETESEIKLYLKPGKHRDMLKVLAFFNIHYSAYLETIQQPA